ncbi:MAG: hypothetical protein HQK97_07545 [Nitrospirae bacterium]|nr:hypothetical protein [Nitrospirota bacterium]
MIYENNAFVGSGILYIDTLAADGSKTGELDVGNTDNFVIEAPKLTTKEMLSSRTENYGQIIAKAVTSAPQQAKFTIRDIRRKNLMYALLGVDNDLTQASGAVTGEPVMAALWKYMKLSKRNLKQSPAPVVLSSEKTLTANDIAFTATGKIIASTVGDFLVAGFAAGQKILITDTAHNNGVKTIATVAQHDITVLETVTDEAAGSATVTVQYTEGTDYEIDYVVGRIIALATGSIADLEALNISYDVNVLTAYQIKANAMTQRDVFIRFVGVNIVDKKPIEIVIHKLVLQPTANVDWIAADFAKLDLSGDIMSTPDGTWDVIKGAE